MSNPTRQVQFHEFEESPTLCAAPRPTESLEDVSLTLKVELGRTERVVKDLLALKVGTVLPLNKDVGASVEVSLGRRAVARGDVIEIDGQYGVRITEIVR